MDYKAPSMVFVELTEAISWEEQERARCISMADAYNHLLLLVTKRYSDMEKTNPQLVRLAKSYASSDVRVDQLNDLYHQNPCPLPVHTVDGKHYPSVSFSVTGFVPLWALYLPKAREALELVESLKDEKAAA